ncbi:MULTISPECIES: tyrosine--tRNA ligase [unclassified Saccharopolyspora]|uniref:tyrosine--tRNA ligase n=1 Tax=unclassified Saccharopolyspora TaxID=2646250 RepID=UPI001CD631E6|nr:MULTISPECIES: tyrosine--tRNA ligase [unclassified Saccharopolyspora]MCA1189955.1 tyrosine--tRNA ligase [Saccharopolyspora sp. 6T]MCA1195917.1 tyrosine--tRNA ligase [Saccharopolyspora sp. 6V]MCA1229138.1 tyrosine--tRNA ligase [Saccharopolyspora sp. 6M]MCA1280132.1 tyrosine--tRNA ligase [Saccharopolyspora sp. 7B]
MSEHILDELSWRGLIAQSTDLDALRSDLDSGPLTLYAGFDPTAPSLHAGHLIPLLTLRRFQLAGHRPVVLSGGATGLIGDPRDVGERNLHDEDTVRAWTERIGHQLAKFVDFDGTSTGALVADNSDWTAQLPVTQFLRDVGKHFSINTMLARETVKRRLEGDGLSYTEFSYMLLQANDYVQLYRRHGTRLQLGGSDQWGNIVAGVDLLRRQENTTAHALTLPLVTDAEGRKFGKSTGGGNVWLDPELTSPYAWYQYFVNSADADVAKYLRLFTFLDREEIEELERTTAERPQQRAGQRRLAEELTTLVHGADQTRQVIAASQALFGRGDFAELDEATLDAVMAEVPTGEVRLSDEPTIVDLLVEAGLAQGRGAARRTVNEGGAYVNNTKIADETWSPSKDDLLHGHWAVIRRGKRHTAGIKVLY